MRLSKRNCIDIHRVLPDQHYWFAFEGLISRLNFSSHWAIYVFFLFHPFNYMGTLLISLLTLILLLISAFVVLIILMQRTSQSGGMGAALGGGAAESAFGSETNNILTKGTIYGTIAFFLVSLGLYLVYQAEYADQATPTTVDATELLAGETNPEVSADLLLEKTTDSVVSDESIASVVESTEESIGEAQTEVEAADDAITTETVPVQE